uniref:Reverse transcriptase zinc-binding domain-containing protein n=2 Tax=Aegilops tauschii subsp. strangulata TaxID=200361 RepID=A0A453RBI1_AEGTS
MTCFPWPKKSINKLEGLLRAFFWQGKSKTSGGHCLVAWDRVIQPRCAGGLGVRDLSAHKQAMMCKFVAKVLQFSDIPCYQWLASQYCRNNLPSGNSSRDTAFWRGLKTYIPLVLFSSSCSLGSGALVSFWQDQWLEVGRLMFVLPVLYSFAKDKLCSIQSQITQDGWDIQLHPNLSHTATQELQVLLDLIANVTPTDANVDHRVSSLFRKELATGYFYKMLTFRGMRCAFEQWIWEKIIPNKHKVFLWLAFYGRLNTRDIMFKKGWSALVSNADCDICPTVESIDHVVLWCRSAEHLWGKLQLNSLACASPDLLSFFERVSQQPILKRKWNVALAACVVTLWHARNDRVFNSASWSDPYTRFYAADLLRLWLHRAKRQQDKDDLKTWTLCLSN